MRFLIVFFLLATPAYADRETPPEPKHDQAQDQSQDQTQEQSQSQESQQTQVAEGGSTGPVTITEVHPDKITIRRAPSLGIVGSPSTAEMMQCYGFGGSAKDGAATGLVCVLQRDLYASFRADKYASGGNPSRAANAWCSRRLNRQDFDSRDQCINEMDLVYMAMYAIEVEPQEVEYMVASAENDEEYKKVVARLAAIEAELKAEREDRRKTEKRIQQTEARAVRRARTAQKYPENDALRKLLEKKNDV